VTFPGGYVVSILYWSDRKVKASLQSDSSFDNVDLSGYWDVGKQRIVINSSEPLWVQIEVLGHELVHAVHDYASWLKQAYAEPIQQEAGETALDEMEEP
jgi:Zn-dependent peptidase ImmA (M78 family)